MRGQNTASMTRIAAAYCFLASAAAYQPVIGMAMRAVPSHSRVRLPSAGFFDEMKKGFEAGMGSGAPPSASPPSSPAEPEAKSSPGDFSFFNMIKSVLSPEDMTPAERVAAGEGVVWSASYTRAWRAKNGMPQDELSVEEAKELSEELSIPIPPEVDA